MDYQDPVLAPHPAKRDRPRDIARLYALKSEWGDLEAILVSHGDAEIVGVEPMPIVPGWTLEVLCSDPDMAHKLTVAWMAYVQSSLHRSPRPYQR